MIRVEILAVGSELLTPDRVDTNSLYLIERLNDLGLEVGSKTVVGDDLEWIVPRVREAFRLADIVVAIGGLGPTSDDLTREAFAEALGLKLHLREDILKKLESRFQNRGADMPVSNRKQALLFEGAEILPNDMGTAPGQWLEKEGKTVILVPGPPPELRRMWERYVQPRLGKLHRGFMVRRVLKIAGLTESMVEDRIADILPRAPGLRTSILASPGQIEIHLTACSSVSTEEAESRLEGIEGDIKERLGDNVFSSAGEEIEVVVSALLRRRNETLACAESCTGGLLGHRITNVPGSSAFFLSDIVAYSNSAKTQLLGVPEDLIQEHGAVSPVVAEAMARGIRARAQATYGLAVTGIAGPSGGSEDKPVGLVYVSLAWDNGTETVMHHFPGTRQEVKSRSSQSALDILRRHILQKEKG